MNPPLFRPRPRAQAIINLDHILRQATALFGSELGSLQLSDQKGGLIVVAAQGFPSDFGEQFRRLPLDAGTPCTRAFVDRQPIIMEDARSDAAFRAWRETFAKMGIVSCRSIPLAFNGGEPIGVISMHSREARPAVEWEPAILRVHGHEIARRVEELS